MDQRPGAGFDPVLENRDVPECPRREDFAVSTAGEDLDRGFKAVSDMIVLDHKIRGQSRFHPPVFGGNKNGMHAASKDSISNDFSLTRLDQNAAGAVESEIAVSHNKTVSKPLSAAKSRTGWHRDLAIERQNKELHTVAQKVLAHPFINAQTVDPCSLFRREAILIDTAADDFGIPWTWAGEREKLHGVALMNGGGTVDDGDANLPSFAAAYEVEAAVDVHGVIPHEASSAGNDRRAFQGIFAMKCIGVQ